MNLCKGCLESSNYYCYGADFRSPRKNYWRANHFSERFYRCPHIYCLGDIYFALNISESECINCLLPGSAGSELFYSFSKNSTALGYCSFSYSGRLCSECIKGYGSLGNYQCGDCSDSLIFLKEFLSFALKLILFLYSSNMTLKNSNSITKSLI